MAWFPLDPFKTMAKKFWPLAICRRKISYISERFEGKRTNKISVKFVDFGIRAFSFEGYDVSVWDFVRVLFFFCFFFTCKVYMPSFGMGSLSFSIIKGKWGNMWICVLFELLEWLVNLFVLSLRMGNITRIQWKFYCFFRKWCKELCKLKYSTRFLRNSSSSHIEQNVVIIIIKGFANVCLMITYTISTQKEKIHSTTPFNTLSNIFIHSPILMHLLPARKKRTAGPVDVVFGCGTHQMTGAATLIGSYRQVAHLPYGIWD